MDLSQVLAALVPLTFVIYWVVDGLKDITNRNWGSLTTKVAAFVGGFAVISLYAHSQLDVGGSLQYISRVPWQGLALAALVIASSGGALSDALRAFNHSDPNVKPPLVP